MLSAGPKADCAPGVHTEGGGERCSGLEGRLQGTPQDRPARTLGGQARHLSDDHYRQGGQAGAESTGKRYQSSNMFDQSSVENNKQKTALTKFNITKLQTTKE